MNTQQIKTGFQISDEQAKFIKNQVSKFNKQSKAWSDRLTGWSASKFLESMNFWIKGFGVEFIPSISRKNNIKYVNTGDTYSLTVLFHKGRMKITTYGDIVEKHYKDFQ